MLRHLAARLVLGLTAGGALTGASAAIAKSGLRTTAIEGIALDTSGALLSDVQIELVGSGRSKRTAVNGSYQFDSVEIGTHKLRARKLGFQPESLVVQVVDRGTRADFMMTPAATTLAALTIIASRRGALTAPLGFRQRMASSQGTFFTDSDMVRLRPRRVSDLMRKVGGLVVTVNGQVFSSRGTVTIKTDACKYGVPVFIDNVQVGGGNMGDPESVTDDALSRKPDFIGAGSTSRSTIDGVKPGDIAAIEIYSGPATAPATLGGAASSCGAILIWTK